MRDTIKAGTILIKEGTPLPEALRIERVPYVPGWTLVEGFDGYGLDREIREVGRTFFCLAGDIRATVAGMDRYALVRRAVKKILANPKSKKFNALEITRVVSKRFLGVPYASLSARSRHIQDSLFLFQEPTEAERDRQVMQNGVVGKERKQIGAEDVDCVIA
jgi:hypothetical protein